MTRPERSRREVLRLGAAAAAGGLSGCSLIDDPPPSGTVDLRGAVYFPARAYNAYQLWSGYDPAVIERDLGYASRVNLNALRIPLSYEFWEEDPEALGESLDHLLETAADRGLGVLLGLFDFVGREPTRENRLDTDPRTATAIHSPSREILTDPRRWHETKRFVRWVMDGHRDDDRLVGIEVMNEPGWSPWGKRFARSMLTAATIRRGRVPLTIGSTSLAKNTEYVSWGVDVMQVHYNFPDTPAKYRSMLKQVRALSEAVPEPIWLTEWQRARPGRSTAFLSDIEWWEPDYASLVPVIQETGLGNFFWSLMVKPAYLLVQRQQGVLTGLFHEDGAVWSAEDARAIKGMSGDRSGTFEERREWPEWARPAREAYVRE